MDQRLKEGFNKELMDEFIAGDSKIYRLYNTCAVRLMLKRNLSKAHGITQFGIIHLN